ncbi:MAG: Ig-like domain-containing protein [Brevefilum sp.]
MIISLMAGCTLPWQSQPEVKTTDLGDPEALPTPTPTREPRPDLPPALVEVDPSPISVIGLNEVITLIFNQEMDTSSVEAAIHFEPRISGRFDWQDAQTVTFTPDQPLLADSRLRVTIDTSAQAANQTQLQEPVELRYQVAEHLHVVQVMPAEGAQEVDPESVVFVVFNQPVVALGETTPEEPGFLLSPEVPGRGKWLNTSTYMFTPDPGMDGGRAYVIELNENLIANSGAGLASTQQLEYRFTTLEPDIVNVLPLPGTLLNLDGPVEITFNVRMDTESVVANFSLMDLEGNSVPGQFEWDQNDRQLRFTPTRLLARETTYYIRLSAEARSAGGLPLINALETTRRTYPAFTVNTSVAPQFESYYGGFGQYTLEFTAPIETKTIAEFINLEPDVAGLDYYANPGERKLWINGYFQPDTTYTLAMAASLQDAWGGQLGDPVELTFTTPPAPPSMSLLSGYGGYNLVFVPATESQLVLQATNISSVSIELSPISVDDLITLLHPDNYRYREIFLPEVREVTTHNLDLTSNRREVVTLPLLYHGESLKPGIYYLGVNSPDIPENQPERYQKYFLIVSENNLVMKVAPEQAFVWGTSLRDFSPLADAPVMIYTTDGNLLVRGRLDEDGQFTAEFDRGENPFATYFALVGTPGEADFAFSISSWQEGFHLYERGINVDTFPAEVDAYIYTDRPIYRPGDTVHFRAVVFARDDGLPSLPALQSVKVSLLGDPGMGGVSTTLYERNLSLSQFGTLAASVELPADVPPGFYWIEISVEDTPIKALYFDVAAYRKPGVDVWAGFEDAELLVGETIHAQSQAEYFFGMPAAGQAVSWGLYRQEATFSLPGYHVGPITAFWHRPFSPGFYMPMGDLVASGEGLTDGEGYATFSFASDDFERENTIPGSQYQYNLEVTVTDPSGFPVSAKDTLILHPERFYIGVQPESYFSNAGNSINFSILTVDWEVSPVGSIPVEATFEAIHWDVEETGNPENPYQYTEVTDLIAGASPVMNREGKAQLSFTPPDPGTYRLTVEAGGALTQVLIWVSGESAALWPAQMYNQLDLTPDSSEYQPGQAAKIFIPNPFLSGAKAMVTVERGAVLSSQVVEISGSGTTITLPITDESIPNLYVSAILLGTDETGRPDYRQGTLKLPVSPLSKTLNVALEINPALTEPGEEVILTLKITDQDGNPVQGEFSVAVVDKALLALVPPNSEPILNAIFSERPLSVQTSLSLYTYSKQLAISPLEAGGLGGGADRLTEQGIREEFPDTAFWQADVITGVDGTARLSIPLPDSLTTWVVDVRGLTEDYLVGQGEVEVLTQKPLMIQPVTPRFLVDGDQVELAAVVHNNTPGALAVDVSLVASGFTLMNTNPVHQVTIDPGQSERVTWWGQVESVASVDLVFWAESGELRDASIPTWGDLEVKRYTMPYTFSTAGHLAEAGGRLELVSLPITTDPSSGELSLVLYPSLLVSLIDGLDALEGTPESDTLTVLSRLLANLNTSLVLRNLALDNAPLADALDESISVGIQQLMTTQNYDGGWSWWVSETASQGQSDPFITAYVLLGLGMADEAGSEIGEYVLDRGRDFLTFEMETPGEVQAAWMLDKLAFQTYALRQTGLEVSDKIDGLYARRSELSPWALGLLALTVREQDGMTARVSTLTTEIEGRAIRSATGVHWENERISWMLPGTPVFNTAVVVYSLAQLDPASTSLPLALGYLMAHHGRDGLWSSSFESGWVLAAVAKAIQGTGEYPAEFGFQAALNDVVIAEGLGVGPELAEAVSASVDIDRLYPDSPNTVMIERGEGMGTLYYRVDLHTYQPAATAPSIQAGINLARDYYLAGEGCPGAEGCMPIDAITLDPVGRAQFITVVVTVNLPHDMYHLRVEDFIPAGAEVINPRFLTSSTVPAAHNDLFDLYDPFARGWGWWYFNEPQVYDDHVVWTADYVPAGTYMLTYNLLPYQRGVYQVLPAHAWQLFYPEVQGTTAGDLFRIE